MIRTNDDRFTKTNDKGFIRTNDNRVTRTNDKGFIRTNDRLTRTSHNDKRLPITSEVVDSIKVVRFNL